MARPKIPLHDWLVLIRHGTVSMFRHCWEMVVQERGRRKKNNAATDDDREV